MTRVLVVDDDVAFRQSVSRDLSRNQFAAETSATVEEAKELLTSQNYDVLLTDLRIDERDGIELLHLCRESELGTRTVLMSAFATARDYETAVELGAVTVLCKPFTSRELILAVQQAAECATGFRGSIHGISLVDILQMFHFSRRSVSILISGSPKAQVHVRDGQVIHAVKGQDIGERAFAQILAANSGAIRTSVLDEDVPQTIERGFDGLLLDALRLVDEASRPPPVVEDLSSVITWSDLPPPLIDEEEPFAIEPGPASGSLQRRAAGFWRTAVEALGGAAGAVQVFALSPDGEHCVPVAGDHAQDSSAAALELARPMLGVLDRLAPDEPSYWEGVNDRLGVGLIRHPELSLMLVQNLASPSNRAWFRSQLATVVRQILGEDAE